MTPPPEDNVSSGEIYRRLLEVVSTLDKLTVRLDQLDGRYLALDVYRADQRTAAAERAALAAQIQTSTDLVTARVRAIEQTDPEGTAEKVTEHLGRHHANGALVGSAIIALLVAIVAAGVTKGFGL